MRNVSVAFEILEEGVKPPPGWTGSSGHLVWDVKMDFTRKAIWLFTRKARWVKDGHRTKIDPNTSGYAGVVSRESVRIALTYAALKGLDVMAADTQNAYLQAPSSEKSIILSVALNLDLKMWANMPSSAVHCMVEKSLEGISGYISGIV